VSPKFTRQCFVNILITTMNFEIKVYLQ